MHFVLLIGAFLLVGPLVALAASGLNFTSLFNERSRLGSLLFTTLALTTLTALFAVPLGTFSAILLERSALRGRRIFTAFIVLGLFVPLPVTAIAWQIILGTWLPPLTLTPGEVAWRPWNQGLLPAAFVHATAALPWVIVIVMATLRQVDRGLEDEARVLGGSRHVFRFVLLPKVIVAMLAATAWIAVQTSTEIPVTDAMMVRTYAEEVYTQIVGFSTGGVAAALSVTLPVLFVAIFLANAVLLRTVNRWPVSPEAWSPSRVSTGRNTLSTLFVGGVVFMIAGLPLLALFWKAGGGGAGEGGSLSFALRQIGRVLNLNGMVLLQTAIAAVTAGIITASLATTLCWWARGQQIRRGIVTMLAVTLALTPGPLIGYALKEFIFVLLNAEDAVMKLLGITLDFPPLRSSLYDQPSPLPCIWACVLRYFAVAVVMIAPVIRALPRELLELATQDGVSPWRYVGRPIVLPAAVLAAIAVTGLSLGEVSASKLVIPHGGRLFILDLFDVMHYGAESTVAAMAIVQLALALPAGILLTMRTPRH
ncbi:amino acid ABC transporter permease [soil metagenome]